MINLFLYEKSFNPFVTSAESYASRGPIFKNYYLKQVQDNIMGHIAILSSIFSWLTANIEDCAIENDEE